MRLRLIVLLIVSCLVQPVSAQVGAQGRKPKARAAAKIRPPA